MTYSYFGDCKTLNTMITVNLTAALTPRNYENGDSCQTSGYFSDRKLGIWSVIRLLRDRKTLNTVITVNLTTTL